MSRGTSVTRDRNGSRRRGSSLIGLMIVVLLTVAACASPRTSTGTRPSGGARPGSVDAAGDKKPKRAYRWLKSTEPVVSGVVVASGRVFGTVTDGHELEVAVFDQATGEVLNRLPLAVPAASNRAPAPVLLRGVIFVPQSDGATWDDGGRSYPAPNVITAYDPATTTIVKWSHRSGGLDWIGPCGKRICAIEWSELDWPDGTRDRNRYLKAFDVDTGVEQWEVSLGEAFKLYGAFDTKASGDPVLHVFVNDPPTNGDTFQCPDVRWTAYRASSGEKLWERTGEKVFADEVVDLPSECWINWNSVDTAYSAGVTTGEGDDRRSVSSLRDARSGKELRRFRGSVFWLADEQDLGIARDGKRYLFFSPKSGTVKAALPDETDAGARNMDFASGGDGSIWKRAEAHPDDNPVPGRWLPVILKDRTASLGAVPKPGTTVIWLGRSRLPHGNVAVDLPFGRTLRTAGCCTPVDPATGEPLESVDDVPEDYRPDGANVPIWIDRGGYVHIGAEVKAPKDAGPSKGSKAA